MQDAGFREFAAQLAPALLLRRDEFGDRPAPIRSSCSAGDRPSSDTSVMPACTWPTRPATRTMKNSSRLLAEIDRKRSRSSSGWLRVGRFLEHAAIELEPRQFAVDEALRRGHQRQIRPCPRFWLRRLRRLPHPPPNPLRPPAAPPAARRLVHRHCGTNRRHLQTVQAASPPQAVRDSAGEIGKGGGIEPMLLDEDAGGETISVVAREDGNTRLSQDRTIIEFRRHQMHGAAVLARAVGQRALVSVQTLVGGQQRGVNVDKPAAPALDEVAAEDAHVAGEADEFDAAGAKQRRRSRPRRPPESAIGLGARTPPSRRPPRARAPSPGASALLETTSAISAG